MESQTGTEITEVKEVSSKLTLRHADALSSGANCSECPFNGRQPVYGYGAPPDRCKAVIVGEAPGRMEDAKGRPFIGPSGALLRSALRNAGFNVLSPKQAAAREGEEQEVYYTNAALCLPSGTDADTYKTSTAKFQAYRCCFQRLKHELSPYAQAGVPIAAVGGGPSKVMVGNSSITKIRSKWHITGSIKILTTWHPAYVLRAPFRIGEFQRDMVKLRYGGPRYEKLRPVHYQVIDSIDEFWELARRWDWMCQSGAIKDSTICLDIESDNVDWWKDQILCIGFAISDDDAYILPEELCYVPEAAEVLTWLYGRSSIKWMGHNFKFDCRFIRYQLGVENVRVDYDSLIGDYVLDENRNHGLKPLLTEFYDVPDYEGELVQRYLKNRNDRYSKVPRPELYKYCAYDVCYTTVLWRDTRKQLEAKGLWEMPFLYPLMASQVAFLDMELHGVLIDKKQLGRLSRTLRKQLAEWHDELCRMAGVNDFNPNSPKQVSQIMYGIFKMPQQKVKNLKPTSTAQPVRALIIKEYERRGQTEAVPYKWIQLYDGWKRLEKVRSSYVDNLIPLIDDKGRVHPDILAYGTETGRPSVRNPALQTIPRTDTGRVQGEYWGLRIKQCFHVPPGYTMVQVDFSQAEMRTAAFLSNDPFLIKCYWEGRDIHGEICESFWPGYHEMDDEIEKKYRRKRVKMCDFGRLYGGGAATVAETMACSMRQARIYLKILDEKLGGFVSYEKASLAHLKKYGYVETLTKRRRRIPLITRDNQDDARKSAANAPVQGMASDLLLMAMMEVHEWLTREKLDAHVLITVHDSIILEVRDDLVDMVARTVKQIMEDMGTKWMPALPWKADMEKGPNWGELKGFD